MESATRSGDARARGAEEKLRDWQGKDREGTMRPRKRSGRAAAVFADRGSAWRRMAWGAGMGKGDGSADRRPMAGSSTGSPT